MPNWHLWYEGIGIPVSHERTIKKKMDAQAIELIHQLRVFQVRGNAVVLDSDLAAIYGVETKVFNQAIRRNAGRFPADFLFPLAAEEWKALRFRAPVSAAPLKQ